MNNGLDNILRNKLKQSIDIPKDFTDIVLHSIQKETINKRNHKHYSLKKLSIVFSLCVICFSILAVSAYPGFQFISKPEIGYVTSSLEEAVENGYIQNVDMDYMYFNNIGIKVNYIVMSDYNLNILFDFQFTVELPETLSHIQLNDLLIYDEQNQLIFCYNNKIAEKFLKSNHINYQGMAYLHSYADGYGIQLIETTPSSAKILYTIRSIKGFPNSKKLNMSFNSISIDTVQNSSSTIKGKWSFELNLPEKFYNRTSKKYVLQEPNNFIELKQAKVTDTLMLIHYIALNSKALNAELYIIDSNGKRYDVNLIETGKVVQNGNEVIATFPLNLSNATEKLNLHFDGDLEFELEVAPE